jgi:DNA-binding transcriptional LysR family regulator
LGDLRGRSWENWTRGANAVRRMLLRHLRYLTALAREQHFARAALACDVSQPALSAALRQLEEELGVVIVERGNRYVGLTREGEFVLAWAQRTLAEHETLLQQLAGTSGPLRGRFRLGAIPSVFPVIPELIAGFSAQYPLVVVSERSMTSIDIVRGLQEYELDGALTYLDGEPLGEVTTLPLFEERYVLVTPKDGPFAGAASVPWRDAASLRLCQQDPSMQNRRILDAVFAEIGVEMHVGLETNSIYAACTHVRQGGWSSIIPEVFAPTLADAPVDVFPLVAPDISKLMGLVVHERAAQPPLVAAFWEASQGWRANRNAP